MSTTSELRLVHEDLSRSLNDRVAYVSERFETFGPLNFRCECGTFDCSEQIELTAGEYAAIRLEPTHFIVDPDHVLYATEFVVLEYTDSYAIVARLGAAERLAATDRWDDTDEPLARDTDASRVRRI